MPTKNKLSHLQALVSSAVAVVVPPPAVDTPVTLPVAGNNAALFFVSLCGPLTPNNKSHDLSNMKSFFKVNEWLEKQAVFGEALHAHSNEMEKAHYSDDKCSWDEAYVMSKLTDGIDGELNPGTVGYADFMKELDSASHGFGAGMSISERYKLYSGMYGGLSDVQLETLLGKQNTERMELVRAALAEDLEEMLSLGSGDAYNAEVDRRIAVVEEDRKKIFAPFNPAVTGKPYFIPNPALDYNQHTPLIINPELPYPTGLRFSFVTGVPKLAKVFLDSGDASYDSIVYGYTSDDPGNYYKGVFMFGAGYETRMAIVPDELRWTEEALQTLMSRQAEDRKAAGMVDALWV